MLARRVQFWLIGLALFVLALFFLRGILLPFVAGMAIAYLLDPICDRLERLGASRTLSVAIVIAGFVLVVVTTLLLLVPPLQEQIVDLASRLPRYLQMLQDKALPWVQRLYDRLSLGSGGALGEAVGGKAGDIMAWIGRAIAGVVSSGLALVNILSLIFITPIVTFYLLRDWDRLVAAVDSWLPRRQAPVIREQVRLIDRTLSGYVRGQSTVCVFLGVFYAVGLSLAGLDFGLAVGLVTGVLSFIPFVGTLFGFAASMGLAFAQFSDWPPIVIVAGIFVVGQFIEGNILTPKLVGDRVGLHPVWVIFALLAGATLFGFLGVLLALPVAAVVGVLTRFGLGRYLASHYFLENAGAAATLADATAEDSVPPAPDP